MTIPAAPLSIAAVHRACGRGLLAAVLVLAAVGPPVLAADEPAPPHIHAHCIPWRGVVLAVGGGALAGWAL